MRVQSSTALLTQTKFSVGLLISLTIALFSLNSQNALASVSTTQSKLDTAQQSIISKNYQQALQIAESVLDKVPNEFAALFIRAQALSQLGQLDKAVAAYEAILKTNTPSNIAKPEIYNNLATLYAQQGRLELARQTLEDGIATNKKYKTLYENLSAIYVEMARGAYSKALKLGVDAKVVHLKTLQLEAVQVASVQQAETSTATEVAMLNTATSKKTDQLVNTKAKQAEAKPAPPVPTQITKAPIKTAPQPTIKTNYTQKQVPQIDKEEVITALQGWAAAWSAQAVDLYLSFYGENFKPDNLSKEVWAVQRRIRLSKPRWVNVRLNNFKVKPTHSDKAVVQLVQDYRADNYHDKTKKQFVMQRTVDGWRILSEQSLAVIR